MTMLYIKFKSAGYKYRFYNYTLLSGVYLNWGQMWFINCQLNFHRIKKDGVKQNTSLTKYKQSAIRVPIIGIIIPYKALNHIFTSLYGIMTGSLSAEYLCARINYKVII